MIAMNEILFNLFILLRQHGVSDNDTTVRRFLHREADQYHMDAEVEYLEKHDAVTLH